MRKLLALILVLCLALTLVGCGSPKEKPVALTVWIGSDQDQAWFDTVAEGFKAANPGTTFDIKIGIMAEGDAKSAVLADVEAAPDVYTFVNENILQLVQNGSLQPVADAEAVTRNNLAGAVEAATVNGTLYAYPATADNGYFMYYNKQYLTEEDVKTLDRMMEVAARNGKYVTIDMDAAWYFYSFFKGAGLDCTLNEDGVTNSCNFNATDTPITGVQVAEAMLAIAKNPGYINATDAEFQAGVKDGSMIAGINGAWNAAVCREAWGDNYGAVKLPTYTVAGQQVQMASFAGYKLVGVNAFSANVEWAMKLANYMTNEESQTSRFTMRNQGPANVKAAASAEVQADPAIAALAAQSDFATAQNVGSNYWSPVDTFGAIMVAGNPDGLDLQEALDTMVAGITAPVE